MDKKENIMQYHPPACAALELELREDQDVLEFTPELLLNNLPNKIDVLVVKKSPEVRLKSGLGAIFKQYNLWEYKNPRDSLNVKTYFRMIGYAGLYLAFQADTDDVSTVTLSFMRERKPVKLMHWLEKNNFTIERFQPGIYHIRKPGHYDMQMIVTSETDVDVYQWITKLSANVNEEDVQKLGQTLHDLHNTRDLLNAESVLELLFRLNKEKNWSKEAKSTMGYLRDLFKDEFEARDKRIAEAEEQIEQRDAQIEQKDAQIEQKDAQIEQKDAQIEQKDAQIEQKDAEIIDLQSRVAALEAALKLKQG